MAEPTVDELIRHLQTELEKCDSIIDPQERSHRQLQIENSIQESLSFQQRYKMLENAGIDPLLITETVRLIKSADENNQSQKDSSESSWCPKCDCPLEEDLNFCPACGHKL